MVLTKKKIQGKILPGVQGTVPFEAIELTEI